MRVKVTKPVGGRVTIVVDDRRGLTGLSTTLRDVPVEDVRNRLGPVLGDWEEKRAVLKDARKRSWL